ncbi:transcription elongation factor GreA [Buchnera aphidicola (Formosaphis micheliae)]|uniref:transcription elongation factor GreA n=1 Tax=Buchnera aphidicola TaxID=9 RepID=UPI0031B8A1A3
MKQKIPMTIHGAEKLIKELKKLKEVKRSNIISAIAEARSHGDLKENAEYHAAREEQSFCEGRIQEIETKLSNAYIIDITKILNVGKVIFGVTITIYNINTKQQYTYKIVGDDEANLKQNLISINSPIIRGLLGKKLMDIVEINTPNGIIYYKILKIDHI